MREENKMKAFKENQSVYSVEVNNKISCKGYKR